MVYGLSSLNTGIFFFFSCPKVPELHSGVALGPGVDRQTAALDHIGKQQQRGQQ